VGLVLPSARIKSVGTYVKDHELSPIFLCKLVEPSKYVTGATYSTDANGLA
jgi:hypothetical protein